MQRIIMIELSKNPSKSRISKLQDFRIPKTKPKSMENKTPTAIHKKLRNNTFNKKGTIVDPIIEIQFTWVEQFNEESEFF